MSQPDSVDREEIAQFARIATNWWDPNGPMGPLHRINPLRLQYCRNTLTQHFALDFTELNPLTNLDILDVGCGGGLLSEPLARMGANMTAIDASEQLIAVATTHAHQQSLVIDYRTETAEVLAGQGTMFDAVISMEVLEHVENLKYFITTLVSLVRPGGALILSTINRTPRSYLQAILGAEYLLRWLPKGTHNWYRFRKPAELRRYLRNSGAELRELTGMRYRPRMGDWQLTQQTEVNYLVYAVRL